MSDPQIRAALLMALMRQLQDRMQAENALLREMRLARLQELEAEKAALAESYAAELRRIYATPGMLASLGADARAGIESAMRELQATASRHADQLRRARDAVADLGRALDAGLGGRGGAPFPAAVPGRGADAVVPVPFGRRC